MQKYTIHDFNRDFLDDDTCLDFILHLVYPDGVICRKCKEVRQHHKLNGRKAYSCDYCGTHVYPLAGTIFEKSTTPLKSWLYAMHLMAMTRCGISAKQIERELGVTYKTAWRIFTQIRKLMAEDGGMLSGTVEVDEAYYGGRLRHPQGPIQKDRTSKTARQAAARRRLDNKTPIVGAVERGGRIHAKAIPNLRTEQIIPLVTAHILPESMVYTDEAHVYTQLPKRGYQHRRVHHQARIYVDGDVHTNTIENFWFLLKTGILGTHHAVSAKYLQGYVDEYTFRYNHRKDERSMFVTLNARLPRTRHGRYGDYSPVG